MFPVEIAKFLRTTFLKNTSSGCFWQSYHSTIKSAGVSVLWFRASTYLQFWPKTHTKCCTNNSLLSRDKTISSLLKFIDHVLSIYEYFLGKHWLLSILIKNLHKVLHKELCTIKCQKNLFPCTLKLVQGFQFQGMIWKTEQCHESKSVKLKTWR